MSSLSEVCAECLKTSNWGCTHLAKPGVDELWDVFDTYYSARGQDHLDAFDTAKAALLELNLGCLDREEILEIIKGYEPVARLDGKGGTIPAGFDLDKDGRTEFGFYWEYEDMEACAKKILDLMEHKLREVFGG